MGGPDSTGGPGDYDGRKVIGLMVLELPNSFFKSRLQKSVD